MRTGRTTHGPLPPRSLPDQLLRQLLQNYLVIFKSPPFVGLLVTRGNNAPAYNPTMEIDHTNPRTEHNAFNGFTTLTDPLNEAAWISSDTVVAVKR